MRFLCVQCDEAMSFVEARGPHMGSVTAVFRCPACSRDVAMLTNPQETQIVRAMHVQLGGRTVPPEPLEAVRGSLSGNWEPDPQAPDEIPWTQEALDRLERVPSFVRATVKQRAQDAAKQQQLGEITAEVLASLRPEAST